MAMKSCFMDELHSICTETVNCKNKTQDPTSVDVKVRELQSKIGILEAENKLLKESCINKQKLLEVVLEHNSVLIKEKSKHVVNPNDKQVSLNKSTCDSQNHMGLDQSNGKKPEHKKLPTMSEIIVKNPRLIKQIMALKQIKIQLLPWATR